MKIECTFDRGDSIGTWLFRNQDDLKEIVPADHLELEIVGEQISVLRLHHLEPDEIAETIEYLELIPETPNGWCRALRDILNKELKRARHVKGVHKKRYED